MKLLYELDVFIIYKLLATKSCSQKLLDIEMLA